MATAPPPLTIFVDPHGMRRLAPFGNIRPPGSPGQQADVRRIDNQIIKGQEDQARFQREIGKSAPPAQTTQNRSMPSAPPAQAATPVRTLPTTVTVPTKSKQYVYPKDIGMYFMVLEFGPYKRDVVYENAKVVHTDTFFLPLPANLAESFGVSYNKANLGPFGGALASALSSGYSQMSSGRDVSSIILEKLKNGVNAAMNDPSFAPIAIDAALRSSEQLRTAFSAATGLAPNPNPAIAMQGVPLRNYSFSWRFAPETKEESKELIRIITALKFLMLPQQGGAFALHYPNLCDVSLWPSSINSLIKFKTTFLTDIKINYAPSGVPSFFAGTQIPTEVELGLSFQEIKIFLGDDFAEDATK